MRNKILLISLVFFLTGISVRSQTPFRDTTTANLKAMALPSPHSIVLRWASTKAKAWDYANRTGYLLQRLRIDKNGKPDPSGFHSLVTDPIVPWTLEQWKQRVDPKNAYAPIAAQALFGKSFIPQNVGPMTQLRNRADDFQNRFGFSLFSADMDSVTATGLALRFEDNEVQRNTQYLYRILVAVQPSDFSIDTAYVLVSAEPAPPVWPPSGLTLKPGDGHILLSWDEQTVGASFSGYWVERSDDGGRHFKRLHERPVIFLSNPQIAQSRPNFVDTTVVNYKKYFYRVTGITPFAKLSLPAKITGFARDLTPPPPPVLTLAKNIHESTVLLKWEMKNAPADLHGFRIGISNAADGPFELDMKRLLPPSERSTQDSRALSGANNYYVVVALDTANNASASMPLYANLIDTIPPAPPFDLVGKADTTGQVTIRWRLGMEPDLLGYRVYRARSEDHVFTLLTGFPLRDTVFVDTVAVHTLSRYTYYQIAALDQNYNPSPRSEILRVTLHDMVAPVAPVFKSVTPSHSGITLSWIRSSSRDVGKHLLFRRKAGTAKWSILQTFTAFEDRYVDRNVTRNVMYEYTLQAQDRSGLRSRLALPVQGRAYDNGRRPGITELRAQPDNVHQVIHLSWAYPTPAAGKYWFVIFRSVAGEPLTRYRSAGSALEFADNDILGWENFSYAVQVFYGDGGRSALSQPIDVQYHRRN